MPIRIGWTRNCAVAIAFSCCGFLVTPLAAHAQNPPQDKLDPFWPKRLPNKWSMQQIVDIYVDKDKQRARSLWPTVQATLTSYNQFLQTSEPNAVLRRYEKERIFNVISSLLFRLISGNQIDLAIGLLAGWVEIAGDNLEDNLLFILPTKEHGVVYTTRKGILVALTGDGLCICKRTNVDDHLPDLFW